jgi:hypothetical protein
MTAIGVVVFLLLTFGPSLYWGITGTALLAPLIWSATIGIFAVGTGWRAPGKGFPASALLGLCFAMSANLPIYFIGWWLGGSTTRPSWPNVGYFQIGVVATGAIAVLLYALLYGRHRGYKSNAPPEWIEEAPTAPIEIEAIIKLRMREAAKLKWEKTIEVVPDEHSPTWTQRSTVFTRGKEEAILWRKDATITLVRDYAPPTFDDFVSLEEWIKKNPRDREVDDATGERLYLREIERFVIRNGHFRLLLEATATDQDFFYATYKLQKTGYAAQQDPVVVAALILEALTRYQEDQDAALRLLRGLEKDIGGRRKSPPVAPTPDHDSQPAENSNASTPSVSKRPPEVDAIFKKLDRLMLDENAQNEGLPALLGLDIIKGIDCDEIPGGKGEFGRDPRNPIPVNGPLGETIYLSNLHTDTAQQIMFHRLGSVQNIDVYETVSLDGTMWDVLFLDLYHPRKSRRAPTGYRIATGAERSKILLGANEFVSAFPDKLQDAIADTNERLLGHRMRPREVREAVEQINFKCPLEHLIKVSSVMARIKAQTAPSLRSI